MSAAVSISIAVEGITDEAVAVRLVGHAGGQAGTVYGKAGKSKIRQHIQGYENAARRAPWLVLVDLDQDTECAPVLRSIWVPQPPSLLCFRIAVRAVEAWLLADRERLASFLGVSQGKLPEQPELLDDPKRSLVDIARASRKSAVRTDMVPREHSGRSVGPAYTSRLIEFASQQWRPEVAARQSESLRRAIACLRNLVAAP
ncbi:MAG: hypothetical protein ACREPY_10915 [Rhodanobacteraceae bacterium]